MDEVMEAMMEVFEFADKHSNDQGHEITINYTGPNVPGYLKRVDIDSRIVWYEWLAGIRSWGYTTNGETYEAIYKARMEV